MAASVAVLALAAPAPVAGAGPVLGAFHDGEFDGIITFELGGTGPGGVVLHGDGTGTFDLSVAAGRATGRFKYQSLGQAEVAGVAAQVTVRVEGLIEGTGGDIFLKPTGGEYATRPTLDGGLLDAIVAPLDPAELADIPLTVEDGECDYFSGSWTEELQSKADDAGLDATVSGIWSAVLRTTGAEESITAINDFMIEVALLRSDYRSSGHVDRDLVLRLFDRAEEISASIYRGDGCEVGSDFDLGAMSRVVAELIDLVIANQGEYTLREIHDVITWGVRAGVLGVGAAYPNRATELAVEGMLLGLLHEALVEGDTVAILLIRSAALAGGFEVVLDALAEAGR